MRSASAARILCAKDQPSRCLRSFDWMILNNALSCKFLMWEGRQGHSQQRFIYRGPRDVVPALRFHLLWYILFLSTLREQEQTSSDKIPEVRCIILLDCTCYRKSEQDQCSLSVSTVFLSWTAGIK